MTCIDISDLLAISYGMVFFLAVFYVISQRGPLDGIWQMFVRYVTSW